MTPIFIKALPDMIAIDVKWTLFSMDRQFDCIHSLQVWVAGYKRKGIIKWRLYSWKHYQMCGPYVLLTFDWLHTQSAGMSFRIYTALE